jgi:hypothetical protein
VRAAASRGGCGIRTYFDQIVWERFAPNLPHDRSFSEDMPFSTHVFYSYQSRLSISLTFVSLLLNLRQRPTGSKSMGVRLGITGLTGLIGLVLKGLGLELGPGLESGVGVGFNRVRV